MKYILIVKEGVHRSKRGLVSKGEIFTTSTPLHTRFPEKFQLQEQIEETAPEAESVGIKKQGKVNRFLSDQYTATRLEGEKRWRIIDESTGDLVDQETYSWNEVQSKAKELSQEEEE